MSSSDATASNTPVRSTHRSLWIINPSRDLLLFVATPVLILPAFLLAQSRWSVEEIALFVFAFGQIGHQLPSMLRAYGDRALFRRHRARFILAPVALLSVSLMFLHWNLHGLILIAAVWGIWHALMQTYGMMRIYDAKVGAFTRTSRHLDFAMCICWFGMPILLSKWRLVTLLDMLFVSGGPLAVATAVQPLKQFWIAATVITTLLFLANLWRSRRAGEPSNPVKLLLCVTSFAFFWYTNVSISNVILGLVMFEVFHDVQYLAIVWVYNRNRAGNDAESGGFTRFLFRRSGALIGLYLGLIFAFGSLHLLEKWAPVGGMKFFLTGFLATTGLLHYYYDGFIWKIRQRETSKSLQLSQQPTSATISTQQSNWFRHLAKWAGFAIPVVWLFTAERGEVPPKLDRYEALRQAVPDSPLVRLELGSEFHLRGMIKKAAAEYAAVLRLDPQNAKAYNNLGLVFVNSQRPSEGMKCFQKSLQILPLQSDAHNNLGNVHADLGNYAQAQAHFAKALEMAPSDVKIRNNLALTLAKAGSFAEAERQFLEAIEFDPESAATHYNFATLLAHQRRYELAADHYEATLKLNPLHADARRKLELVRKIIQHKSA